MYLIPDWNTNDDVGGACGQVLLLFVVTLMINGACISQQPVEKKFWVAPLIITRASFGMMIPWSFLRLNEILR